MKKPLFLVIVISLAMGAASAHGATISPLQELVLSSRAAAPQQTGIDGNRAGKVSQDASLSESKAQESLIAELEPDDFLDEPSAETGAFDDALAQIELPKSDIPLTMNRQVGYFIRYFQTSGRKAFSKWLSRSERYIPMMKELLRKEGLPEDLVYLAMIESGFTPHAYSVASAVGPWQFMSGTGKRYDLRIDPWIDERRDPVKSTGAAALYLKELYALFNNDWYLAAAGYNAGENKILRAINMYETRDFWELSQGSYLKRETKDYVPKLLAAAIIAKEPAKFGFADIAYLPPIEYDEVSIPSRTDLDVAAKACDIPTETIKALNPELRRWCTPPNYPDYKLKIPKGKKENFEAEYAKVPEEKRFTERITYARYRVKKRETLATIARRYGTTTETLTELNHLSAKSKLAGKVLKVPVQVAALDAAATEKARRVKSEKEFKKFYVVKKGDTAHTVARKFNISTKLLAAWNNLKGKMSLKPGRKIVVAKYVEKKGRMAAQGDNG
ncbi:MAG: transglycosylase SLT domain-containing protein [Geobacter sp.]|nr:transglycosylase SLT domain-containing protein [Geobacter sp.]